MRHVDALAGQLMQTGHEVRVLAPYDPDDRRAALMHRGARPHAREAPDWFVPLGRSIGVPSNGAVSNVSFTPESLTRARREIERGRFDVVHVHEPIAPVAARDAVRSARTALVAPLHAHPTTPITNAIGPRRGGGIWPLNRRHPRIAASEPPPRPARRYSGG